MMGGLFLPSSPHFLEPDAPSAGVLGSLVMQLKASTETHRITNTQEMCYEEVSPRGNANNPIRSTLDPDNGERVSPPLED